ncbi:hypothetical protein ACFU8W_43335 [Streptomyces sp. NPDC057565]|uniref:hypothetical protein n=1 Tax=Streptomyces sp. NPDC057565 TaxID=3346169 RepID=UPI0036A9BC6F
MTPRAHRHTSLRRPRLRHRHRPATVTVLYGLPLLLPVLPCPMAAAGRRAELRATALGFARMLAEVLHTVHLGESQDDPAAPPAALSVARTPTHARRRAATPYATG